jgi:acetoin utilization protein AcuC
MPEKVPEGWLSKWDAKSPVKLPSLMRDDPRDYPQVPRAAEIACRNDLTVGRVIEKVLPGLR